AHEKALGEAYGQVPNKDGELVPRVRVKVVDKDAMIEASRS
ncbi:MAG: hypothetical protein JWO12_1691, partial [Frankiales bacterium]|nr:hypothetical protein [Frankiales bacterium]